MRVAMLTPYYYPVIGGTERLIENISLRLNEKGVPTDIITLNASHRIKPVLRGKTEEINKMKVTRVPALANRLGERLFQVGFIPGGYLSLLKEYDILHFHNDVDLTFPLFSYFVNKPKIFHFHCLDVTYNFYDRNFLKRKILKNTSDLYVAISSFVRGLLLDLGFPEEKIRIVPNGVDTEEFKPIKGEKEEDLLLFVGRLVPNKGLHVLLRSLTYLTTPIRLMIVGPPSSHFPGYFNNVLGLIGNLNEKKVHRVTYVGVQKTEELIRLYQKASLLICPSLSEPFGIVNLEALSCETPVVASNIGGIPDVVEDHVNGLLVPPNDALGLTNSIQRMLENKHDRDEFGKNGRILVKKCYSSEVVVEKLFQIYEDQTGQKNKVS
jgi:glycosyltransferase involved in cell wall biosynthesis